MGLVRAIHLNILNAYTVLWEESIYKTRTKLFLIYMVIV